MLSKWEFIECLSRWWNYSISEKRNSLEILVKKGFSELKKKFTLNLSMLVANFVNAIEMCFLLLEKQDGLIMFN